MPTPPTPEGCDDCPDNTRDKDEVEIPYVVRGGVAIVLLLIILSQCIFAQYGRDVGDDDPTTIPIGHVGQWTIKTKEPNYILTGLLGGMAMTALGFNVEGFLKRLSLPK